MYKVYDSHIHFNMKAQNIIEDFKRETSILAGFILILNSISEKKLFLEEFSKNFKENYPLSTIALNYELVDAEFVTLLNIQNIKFGIKLHPRLSNITKDEFEEIILKLVSLKFDFIIIDCFYYGSNLESHINLELAIYIAKYFKDIKIILAHGGGHRVLEYMLYTRDLNNIYYDFSLTSNYLENTSIRQDIINFIRFNNQKVFFGSDYPDFTILKSIDTYKKMLCNANLDETQSQGIFLKNILNFLEVDSEK